MIFPIVSELCQTKFSAKQISQVNNIHLDGPLLSHMHDKMDVCCEL